MRERAPSPGRVGRRRLTRVDPIGEGASIWIREATDDDRVWANARYDEIRFRPSPDTDRLLVAGVGEERIGCGRIVPMGSVGELGGMYVAPGHRGEGVAQALVGALLDRATEPTLFCLPFAHLTSLYERFGFRPAEGEPPAELVEKLRWCRVTYPDPVVLLARG